MPLTLNFTNDYQVFDGLERVQLSYSRRGRTQDAAVNLGGEPDIDSITSAKRTMKRSAELAASFGAYVAGVLDWYIPDALIVNKARRPKPGDFVTDADNIRWTIKTAEFIVQGSLWRLGCVNPIIAYDLRDLISIETPTLGQDEPGALTRTWTTRYVDVPCRVQQSDSDELVDERLVHGVARKFLIYVGDEVNVQNDAGFDRLLFRSRYYDIIGYGSAQRLDELPVIEAILKP